MFALLRHQATAMRQSVAVAVGSTSTSTSQRCITTASRAWAEAMNKPLSETDPDLYGTVYTYTQLFTHSPLPAKRYCTLHMHYLCLCECVNV